MYYDNKSTFYVKQYGPVVLVLMFSLLLIGSGIFIFVKSYTTEPVSSKVTVATQSNSQNSQEQTAQVGTVPDDLNKLQPLQKSDLGYITDISNDGMFTAKIGNDKFSFYLIGIDFSKSQTDALKDITNDLNKKKIRIAFDYKKVEDSKIYAYIYLEDNTLYNEIILDKGLATLRTERDNVSELDTLLNAEKTARANFYGLWNNN